MLKALNAVSNAVTNFGNNVINVLKVWVKS